MRNTVTPLEGTGPMPFRSETAVTSTPITPMAMIGQALQNGAGIEVISQLMGLQERWDANQARKAFDTAISQAKAKITPVLRNKAGHNNKRYADLAAIAAAVDPVIAEYGLSYRFRSTQTDKITVTCILSHRDGHSEESSLSGPADTSGSKNAIQAIGSTLTYLQRYSLVQALGLAATDDDDGKAAGAGGNITDEQATEIQDLIRESGSNIDLFLEFVRAESISDIRLGDYPKAVAKLRAKIAKNRQEPKP